MHDPHPLEYSGAFNMLPVQRSRPADIRLLFGVYSAWYTIAPLKYVIIRHYMIVALVKFSWSLGCTWMLESIGGHLDIVKYVPRQTKVATTNAAAREQGITRDYTSTL